MAVMENIRQGANSPVMKLLFGAIVIVFVFWGIGGQRQTQTLATVNGTRITDTPLQKELRAQTRGMAMNKQQQASLEENIIVQLIREQLLLEEAEKIGLRVSDYEVAIAIMQDPSFHDAEGMFSKKLMDQALQMNGWREDRFEADLRQRLLLFKVQQSVIYGVNVSDAELKQQFMAAQTSMSVKWVMLSPDLLKDDVPVTDDAIDAVLASEEGKVRSRYESEKARRWSQPRKIQYATILLRTDLTDEQGQMPEDALRSRLETILSDARSGADFADLARQHSEDLTAARGGEQGMRREDQIDAELAKAMVVAGKDGITDIVATPRGLIVAHVQDLKEAEETSFDDAKRTITREIIAEGELSSFTTELATELLAAWSPGAPPTQRLGTLGLKVQDAGPFSPTQPKLVGAGTSPELTAALSKLPSPGVLAQAFTTSVGTILVEVTSVDKPDEAQFELIKPMIKGQALNSKRQGFLVAWLDDLTQRAAIERFYMPLEDI
jgi:peptidyl-prolyl cis-trans isomerase D